MSLRVTHEDGCCEQASSDKAALHRQDPNSPPPPRRRRAPSIHERRDKELARPRHRQQVCISDVAKRKPSLPQQQREGFALEPEWQPLHTVEHPQQEQGLDWSGSCHRLCRRQPPTHRASRRLRNRPLLPRLLDRAELSPDEPHRRLQRSVCIFALAPFACRVVTVHAHPAHVVVAPLVVAAPLCAGWSGIIAGAQAGTLTVRVPRSLSLPLPASCRAHARAALRLCV